MLPLKSAMVIKAEQVSSVQRIANMCAGHAMLQQKRGPVEKFLDALARLCAGGNISCVALYTREDNMYVCAGGRRVTASDEDCVCVILNKIRSFQNGSLGLEHEILDFVYDFHYTKLTQLNPENTLISRTIDLCTEVGNFGNALTPNHQLSRQVLTIFVNNCSVFHYHFGLFAQFLQLYQTFVVNTVNPNFQEPNRNVLQAIGLQLYRKFLKEADCIYKFTRNHIKNYLSPHGLTILARIHQIREPLSDLRRVLRYIRNLPLGHPPPMTKNIEYIRGRAHVEIVLVNHLLRQPGPLRCIYLGISLRCCLACHMLLNVVTAIWRGLVYYCGCHGFIHPGWNLDDISFITPQICHTFCVTMEIDPCIAQNRFTQYNRSMEIPSSSASSNSGIIYAVPPAGIRVLPLEPTMKNILDYLKIYGIFLLPSDEFCQGLCNAFALGSFTSRLDILDDISDSCCLFAVLKINFWGKEQKNRFGNEHVPIHTDFEDLREKLISDDHKIWRDVYFKKLTAALDEYKHIFGMDLTEPYGIQHLLLSQPHSC